MKSYDEMYKSVLRRRDEQMAKKRRRIAVLGSAVLPAVMLTAAAGVGVAAWQSGPDAEGGASAGVNTGAAEALLRVDVTKPPVRLVDGRLFLINEYDEYGFHDLDITDGISEDKPYIGEGVEPETGMRSIFVIGGTPENYGWARFVMYEKNEEQPELSKWKCYSCNTFTPDRQDRKWYAEFLSGLSGTPEETGIFVWTMTERAWELAALDNTVSVTATQDSLDGYTAALELVAVTHEPADGEYYYTAERVVLTVNDPHGKTATVTLNSIDPIYSNVTGKLDTDENGNMKGGVKLWAMDVNGEKHYMVSLSCYSEKSDEEMMNADPNGKGGEVRRISYPTVFFGCDPENLADGTLTPYDDGCVYSLTEFFRFEGGTTFTDEGRDLVMIFHPDGSDIIDTYYMGSHPIHGRSDQGYSVGLTLFDLTHIPEHDGEDYYAAGDAKLFAAHEEYGYTELYLSQCETVGVYDEFVKNLNASHEEDCVTLLKLNDRGKEHYVIMLRNYHGENDMPYYRAAFFEFDPKNRTLIPYTYLDYGPIPITPLVEVENVDGRDMLFTEKADKSDISYVNEWDYIAACCNKAFEFDHENHTVSYYLPLCEF